jgi:hypothetical protein
MTGILNNNSLYIFFYSFIYRWESRLIPYLSYCNTAAINMDMHMSLWYVSLAFLEKSQMKNPEERGQATPVIS